MNSSLIKFHFFIAFRRTKSQRNETHLFRNVEGSASSGRVMPTAAKHFPYHRVVRLFQTLQKRKKKEFKTLRIILNATVHLNPSHCLHKNQAKHTQTLKTSTKSLKGRP
jgi:hypothetical protein